MWWLGKGWNGAAAVGSRPYRVACLDGLTVRPERGWRLVSVNDLLDCCHGDASAEAMAAGAGHNAADAGH